MKNWYHYSVFRFRKIRKAHYLQKSVISTICTNLASDTECATYIQTANFKTNFAELWVHDKQEFDTPVGWNEKEIRQSPLVMDFPALWNFLKEVYLVELPQLAFVAVPKENEIAKLFTQIVEQLILKE